jgi:murein DD-endopeptidase MepM/ murein hydrolase activator NlpD
MLRAHRARTPGEVAWRLLAPLLSIMLLLTVEAATAPPVEAGSGAGSSTAIRQRQLQAEATMLRADKQIKRLQNSRRQHARRLAAAKRTLDRAIDRRDARRHALVRTAARLERAELGLARTVRVRPNPRGTQVVDRPAARRHIRTLEQKSRQLERRTRKLERDVDVARKSKQARQKASRARIATRRAARERAEDRLTAAIRQMMEVSRQRADDRLSLASVRGFRRPAAGSISQRYGCTGYGANPRRGGCRHFHDGIDIAAKRGTPVRASADGYVAYVGRNPWDAGSRAYVVLLVHARGYESIYGHLQPKRLVRAGTRVERGDLIGRIGVTGHSSGPHVHWEVSRGFRTLDPLRAGRRAG